MEADPSREEALAPEGPVIRVKGPATLSNLGPGFDAVGLCLTGPGDHVEAWQVDRPGVHLLAGAGTVAWQPPLKVEENTAGMAARKVMDLLGEQRGLVLRLHKGIPPGSGLGSSAASAVAGAWAANRVFGEPLPKAALIEAVLDGEAVAAGTRHGDNVLPALFGGLVLIDPDEPSRYRQVPVPPGLSLVVVLPAVQVLTREARAILPDTVPLREAVRNAASFAMLVDAFHAGDWEEVGRRIMSDRLVEPRRSKLVPCYAQVRGAAMEGGALGCALSGSGPALFALTDDALKAPAILEAMLAAARAAGVEAQGFVSAINREGVC